MDRGSKRGAAAIWMAGLVGLGAALAADETPFEVAVLVAPAGSYSDMEGFENQTGFGLGAAWSFTSDWSVELRGLVREDEADFASFEERTFELGIRRALGGNERWRPFLLAGAHYHDAEVSRDVVCTEVIGSPCPPLSSGSDEVGPYLGGGVDWRFGDHAALRADGRLMLTEDDASGDLEVGNSLTLGVVFRF